VFHSSLQIFAENLDSDHVLMIPQMFTDNIYSRINPISTPKELRQNENSIYYLHKITSMTVPTELFEIITALLEGLEFKMSQGANPDELRLKWKRLEMDKDTMLAATKVEEDRVKLDREKFDFEQESQRKEMNASINATQVSAQTTRIETLNITLAGLTNTFGHFKDDETMSNVIRAHINSVLAKIQVETDNVYK